MSSADNPARPLPVPVTLYLFSLYISCIACAGLFITALAIIADAWHVPEIAYFLLLLIAVTALALFGNIRAIHGRRHSAPSYSRALLIIAGVLTVLSLAAGLLMLFYGFVRHGYGGLMESRAMTLFMVASGQNLIVIAAWILYWRRAPGVQQTFGTAGEFPADRAPYGSNLSRLAGLCITVSGLLYLFCTLCMDDFHLGMLLSMLLWAVLGFFTYRLSEPSRLANGNGSAALFSFCLAALTALWLFDIAVWLSVRGFFGEKGYVLLSLPHEFVFALITAVLCYAAYRSIQPSRLGLYGHGLAKRLGGALRSGATWLEPACVVAFAWIAVNMLLPTVLMRTEDASFFCFALALACTLAAALGGVMMLLNAPENALSLLRVVAAAAFFCVLVGSMADFHEHSGTDGIALGMVVTLYRAHLPKLIILGLLAAFLWARAGTPRPAAVTVLRGIGWYYVIKIAAYAAAIGLIAADPSAFSEEAGRYFFPRSFESAPFIFRFAGADSSPVMGPLAVGLLFATRDARQGKTSLTPVLGWGFALLTGAVFGDMLVSAIYHAFVGNFDYFLQRLDDFGYGQPWMRPLPVALAVLLWVSSTAPKERAWFGLPPIPAPGEEPAAPEK